MQSSVSQHLQMLAEEGSGPASVLAGIASTFARVTRKYVVYSATLPEWRASDVIATFTREYHAKPSVINGCSVLTFG